MFKRNDRVVITHKNNIEGTVVGFYAHSGDAVIRTDNGNEWIVSPIHLELLNKKVADGMPVKTKGTSYE